MSSGLVPSITYKRAEPGKPCVHPVSTKADCKKAEAFFWDAVYEPHRQGGWGLPYGCISDKVTPGTHSLYWNPLGVTKSLDPNLQQICRSLVEAELINIPGNCPKQRLSD